MALTPRLGTGTTVTFGTTSFAANVITVGLGGITRPSVDVTHLGTTTAKEYIQGELYDGGELTMHIEWDPPMSIPISGVPETITPDWGGNSNTTPFSGFVTGVDNINATEDERMEADITIKVTGEITNI